MNQCENCKKVEDRNKELRYTSCEELRRLDRYKKPCTPRPKSIEDWDDPYAPIGSVVTGNFIKTRYVRGLWLINAIFTHEYTYINDEIEEMLDHIADRDTFVLSIAYTSISLIPVFHTARTKFAQGFSISLATKYE